MWENRKYLIVSIEASLKEAAEEDAHAWIKETEVQSPQTNPLDSLASTSVNDCLSRKILKEAGQLHFHSHQANSYL